ncbi:hypothetical protein J6S88_05835 [bacterium]|nr:hypothetical protein [bacterium]
MKIKIIRAMGYKRGREAIGLIKSAKKAGCTDIKLWSLDKDVVEIMCKHPTDNKPTIFKFDFARNRQYQTNEYSATALLPWDRKLRSRVTEISSISSGRDLGTIIRKYTSDNGNLTSDVTEAISHTSGNTYERVINAEGKAEYFKTNINGKREQLFV